MDKKNYYSSRQGSNKALSTEARKLSDCFLSKPSLPRSGKRRENSNFKTENNQRNNYNAAPKLRTNFDKRPKPRSCFGGATTTSTVPIHLSSTSTGLVLENSATNDGQNDDFEIELNSIYAPGSKKQNLNHLLNFHYNTKEYGGLNVFGRYNNGNRNQIKKPKYNKEQFLQANFQFVIKSNAKNSIDDSCPDTLVEWPLIEQINIQTTEEPQCPICLYPPISAKLTRCGHVYCWPCILHYLALSDKTWRKCPICYDAIHLSDLKSTSIIQQINFKVDDIVTLQLMKRKKGSMLIEKVNSKIDDDDDDINIVDMSLKHLPHVSDSIEIKRFSKFLLADHDEILKILAKEYQELMLGNDLDSPDSVFIQQALDLLKDRKMLIAKEMNIEYEELDNLIDLMKINNNDKVTKINERNIDETGIYEDNVQNLGCAIGSSNKGAIQKAKCYYFYQSVDGQNIFLHPINVKMLQAMYGSLDKGPTIIKSKILQKENQSMDEEHRKKFTCLGHLPLTCQFEIVEVQFEPPTVSDEVLKMFKDDIMLRQKTRQRRAREEKKREKEINDINERQMGKLIARSANIDIQSSQQFPTCGFEDSLSGHSISDASVAYVGELVNSPPTASVYHNSFASFANIVSSSPTKELWPTLDHLNTTRDQISSDSVWAKSITTTTSKQKQTKSQQVEQFDDNLDDIHITRNNLSDVLAEAFEKKKKSEISISDKIDSPASSGNNKKNKKNKKTLLFSTGMSFGGN